MKLYMYQGIYMYNDLCTLKMWPSLGHLRGNRGGWGELDVVWWGVRVDA